MPDLVLIAPELILLATAILALFADVLFRGRERAPMWLGAAGALLAAAAAWAVGQGVVSLFGQAYAIDGAAQVARIATALLTGAFLVWLAGAGVRGGGERTYTALVLFTALGALLMCAAHDWVVLLLAMEVATMPAYVLIGFDRSDDRGLEGALKYFLMSMIATALFLYGLSFVVGMSGSTLMAATKLQPGIIGALAAAFIAAGLLAKLSAAPFQWWAPDAYAGASAASVAFISSVPKVAGLLAFARVVQVVAPQVPSFQMLLIGAALLSMIVGNFAAYPQTDLRRMMAYSGVAHAGYLIVGLAAASIVGLQAALFYAIAYAVPSMGVMLVAANHGETLADLRGLSVRSPLAAWTTTVLLLSLIGVPPLAGFMGKLYLFTASIDAGLLGIAVVAILMSAVSAGFYFRIIRAMFFEAPEVPVERGGEPIPSAAVVALCGIATIALGIASAPVLVAITLAMP